MNFKTLRALVTPVSNPIDLIQVFLWPPNSIPLNDWLGQKKDKFYHPSIKPLKQNDRFPKPFRLLDRLWIKPAALSFNDFNFVRKSAERPLLKPPVPSLLSSLKP